MQQSNEKELYKNENVHFKMVVLQTQNKKTKIKPFFLFLFFKQRARISNIKKGWCPVAVKVVLVESLAETFVLFLQKYLKNFLSSGSTISLLFA